MLRAILAIIIIATLAGCGGGGGSAIPTTNVTRQIQAGDQVTYSISGTATTRRRATYNLSGTATVTTFNDSWIPDFGNRELRQVVELDIRGGGESAFLTWNSYVEQDSAGNIYYVGLENGDYFVGLVSATDSPIMYPGYWSAGQAWSFDSTWDGSESYNESCSCNVTAYESAAGFMSYKLHTVKNSNGDSSSEDEWFVPDLGYLVKTTLTADTGDVLYRLTLTYRSKNF